MTANWSHGGSGGGGTERMKFERNVLSDILQISALLDINEDGTLVENPEGDEREGDGDGGVSTCNPCGVESHEVEMGKKKKLLKRRKVKIRKLRKELEEAKGGREEAEGKLGEVEARLRDLWGTVVRLSESYKGVLVKLRWSTPNFCELEEDSSAVEVLAKVKQRLTEVEIGVVEESVDELLATLLKVEGEVRDLRYLGEIAKHAQEEKVEVEKRLGGLWEGFLKFGREYTKILWKLGVVHPNLEGDDESSDESVLRRLEKGLEVLDTGRLEEKVVKLLTAKQNLGRVLGAVQKKLLFLEEERKVTEETGGDASPQESISYAQQSPRVDTTTSEKLLTEKTDLEDTISRLKTTKEKLEVELAVLSTKARILEAKTNVAHSTSGGEPQEAASVPETPPPEPPSPVVVTTSTIIETEHRQAPAVSGCACLCGSKFGSTYALRHHLNYHSPNKRFPCKRCPGLSFYFFCDFRKHLVQIHGGTSLPTATQGCSLCGMLFRSRVDLYKHRAVAHGLKKATPPKHPDANDEQPRKEPPTTSEELPSTSGTPPKVHAEDTQQPPGVLMCICGLSFKTPNKLRTHLMYHNGEKRFQCKTCHRRFSYMTDLKRHMKQVHKLSFSMKKVAGCPLCGKAFRTRKELNQHQAKAHNKTRQRTRVFKSSEALLPKLEKEEPLPLLTKCHAADLTNPEKLACICGAEFFQSCHLNKHLRYHTSEKKFECPVCHKLFYFRSYWTKHLKAKHKMDVTSRKKYGCSLCGKSLRSLSDLRRHLNTAHKPKSIGVPSQQPVSRKGPSTTLSPFKTTSSKTSKKHGPHPENNSLGQHTCLCGRSFGSDLYLKQHLRYYFIDKRFSCGICRRSFQFNCYLKRHMVQSHKICVPLSQTYECPVCGQSFRSMTELSRHRSAVHPSPEVPATSITTSRNSIKSESPKKPTTGQNLIRKNVVSHGVDGLKPEPTCLCGKIFGTPKLLKEHVVYYTEKRFPCHLCPSSFYWNSKLKRHLRDTHRVTTAGSSVGHSFRVKERHRSKITHQPQSLKTGQLAKIAPRKRGPYKRRVKSGVGGGVATPEGSNSSAPAKQLDHAVNFSDSSRMSCICGHISTNRRALQKHVWYNTTSRHFVCGVCKTRHVYMCDLIKHLSHIHKVTDLSSVGCPKCRVNFGSIHELWNHSKTVHGISTISVGVAPKSLPKSTASVNVAEKGVVSSSPRGKEAVSTYPRGRELVSTCPRSEQISSSSDADQISSTRGNEQHPPPTEQFPPTTSPTVPPPQEPSSPVIKVERDCKPQLSSLYSGVAHRFDPSKPGFVCKCGAQFESKDLLRSHIYEP